MGWATKYQKRIQIPRKLLRSIVTLQENPIFASKKRHNFTAKTLKRFPADLACNSATQVLNGELMDLEKEPPLTLVPWRVVCWKPPFLISSDQPAYDNINGYNWLMVWNMTFIFPNSWDDDPIWLIFFQRDGFNGGRKIIPRILLREVR